MNIDCPHCQAEIEILHHGLIEIVTNIRFTCDDCDGQYTIGKDGDKWAAKPIKPIDSESHNLVRWMPGKAKK